MVSILTSYIFSEIMELASIVLAGITKISVLGGRSGTILMAATVAWRWGVWVYYF